MHRNPDGSISRRKYAVKFRFSLSESFTHQSQQFVRHYAQRWSRLMAAVLSERLSTRPSIKSGPTLSDLEALRELVPRDLSIVKVLAPLMDLNPRMAKLAAEAGPAFDAASHDLKVYILAVMGVTPSYYKKKIMPEQDLN